MNSIKGFGSSSTSLKLRGFVAVLAAVALTSLVRLPQAEAADIESFSFGASNAGSMVTGGGMGAGKASPKLAEAVSKIDAIDAMVAALKLQLNSLQVAWLWPAGAER